ncbi:MAG: rubrerythrin family protein [Lentisphaeria bacterium]|jgi:rubrerythrin|nr:rubrerythrin family protein [Lentisphaeria bacterium]
MGNISIRNTRTERNLLYAFAGESQARNRYTYFASQARKEGLMQIAAIFAETADQEKEHAERFFKFLEGGSVTINATYPAGVIGNTAANLAAAAEGEYDEWHTLYPGFAEVARQEGFTHIGMVFDYVCIAEKQHEKRYRHLLQNLENDQVFTKPEPVVWRCMNCGYIHTGTNAPDRCPSCDHDRGYFEILAENW